jgi:hypothetical protein
MHRPLLASVAATRGRYVTGAPEPPQTAASVTDVCLLGCLLVAWCGLYAYGFGVAMAIPQPLVFSWDGSGGSGGSGGSEGSLGVCVWGAGVWGYLWTWVMVMPVLTPMLVLFPGPGCVPATLRTLACLLWFTLAYMGSEYLWACALALEPAVRATLLATTLLAFLGACVLSTIMLHGRAVCPAHRDTPDTADA